MGKYKRMNGQEKWKIIEPIIKNQITVNKVSKETGIITSVLWTWLRKYKEVGIEGLDNGKGWKQYSSKLKKQAIEDVLVNKMSKNSVIAKYEISSISVLDRWIKHHNSGKELAATSSGRVGTIMRQGRKTTLEERIEISQYTIARNFDYKSAMGKYDVSYQQVYSWVNKYKDGGLDALRDNRGRSKATLQLTENEELRLRIKELEARNEYLEMESDIEKKLEELRHRYANIH